LVSAYCSTATAHLVDNRQTRRTVLVEFFPRIFDRFIRAATSGHWLHDFLHENVRGPFIVSRYTATPALGDDADELEVFGILHHWRASAT